MQEHILPSVETSAPCARITLEDPARRNALTTEALTALERAIEAVGSSDARVLLLAGRGETFCSGFDLARCTEDPRAVEPMLEGLSRSVARLRALDIPVVARVQGAALAGGCALLTGCDFVVVAEDAQLGYPTHRIGISPAVSIPSLMSRMGPSARSLLLSNEIIDGTTALARGLATHSAPPGELDAEVERLLARLCANGPEAMRATKVWLRRIEAEGSGAMGPARGIDDRALADACGASLALAGGDEFASMLREFWERRRRGG